MGKLLVCLLSVVLWLYLNIQQRWEFSSDQQISSFFLTKYLEKKCVKLFPKQLENEGIWSLNWVFPSFHQWVHSPLIQVQTCTCKMMLFLSSQHMMATLYGEGETCRPPCCTLCYTQLCKTKYMCGKEVWTNLKSDFYTLICYAVYLLPYSNYSQHFPACS